METPQPLHSLPPTSEMEQAYLNRDATYDGVFFLGVRTTGVFCRPSCPARKPLPQNVDYFAAPRDAIMAGYRPCKRCEPLNVQGALLNVNEKRGASRENLTLGGSLPHGRADLS